MRTETLEIKPMHGDDSLDLKRREFIQASAAIAGGTTLALAGSNPASAAADLNDVPIPTRKLGKSGIDVTILNLGTFQPQGLDKMLRLSYANGIRYFDTAASYGSEPGIKSWLESNSAIRKEIFLVSKDSPASPKELIPMLDERLKKLGTDYLDLIFVHALGDHNPQHGVDWPKSKEFKETVEAIKKSGKAKLVGFSTHHPRRAEFLQSAAEGGFVDVIMLKFTPWLDKDSALNKAIDACHKKGIGLVSMKQIAGNPPGAFPGDQTSLKQVAEKLPEMLKERGLQPYQGLLQAIWTDERIASACVSMRNTDQIRENVEAAKTFKPLLKAEIDGLRKAFLAAGPTMCADCEGQCQVAAKTDARLGYLTRFLTYHEHHGDRHSARANYAALTEAEKNWRGADLEAARAACPSGLDFAKLLPQVDEKLA